MRVLHVITSLRIGGAERLMTELLPRFQQMGYEVELAVFDGTRTPFYDAIEEVGIPVHVVGSGLYSLRSLWNLLPLVKRADIVHTHNTPCQYAVALLHRLTHALLVTTEHSTNNRRRGKMYWKALDQWMYSRYKQIICISATANDILREYIPKIASKCSVVPNGICYSKFADAERADLLPYGVPDDGYVVAMVAGFRWEKDQPTIIRAMRYLPIDVHLLLVGGGEVVRQNECQQLAEQMGVAHRVHFLGMRQDVPQLLKRADVVVLSSHFEGLSLSSLEGMASGRPFIASDVDGLREVVNGAGLLFPEGDECALADTIQSLYNDAIYAKNIAQRCSDRARGYDIEVMACRYVEVYNRLHD